MKGRFEVYARKFGPAQADLLADRAVWGLSDAEHDELRGAGAAGDESFELAAAAVDLACGAGRRSRMPEELRARVLADATARFGAMKPAAAESPTRRRGLPAWLPWTVAAAACVMAGVGLVGWRSAIGGSGGQAMTTAERREAILSSRGAGRWNWVDFAHPVTQEAPEIRGVSGDVVWSQAEQRGVMRLRGLKRNDPGVERYQLWIIDKRGLDQRVNGGVFDAGAEGETLVEFKPELAIDGAAIFAVTIERPEGVVVSTMERRVCAAIVGS